MKPQASRSPWPPSDHQDQLVLAVWVLVLVGGVLATLWGIASVLL